MIVDLSEILESGRDFEFVGEPNLEEEAARVVGKVQAAGRIAGVGHRYKVTGTISGQIENDCTRCLVPIASALSLPFEVSYVDPESDSTEVERQVDPADLEIAVAEEGKLNIEDLVREQIILSLPTRFLCKEDCKGLCDKCGANKNAADCGCDAKYIDPRWAQLKNLKF
jgi:uncharacterized protein